MASEPLLQLDSICRYFDTGGTQVRALHEISLNIEQGEFVAIMGQSGSGKSTLMNILGCLDKPTSGHYRVGGHAVNELDVNALSALRLKTFGFVFQRYQLLANQSALENVAMPAIYGGINKSQRHERAAELLHRLDLGSRIDHKPNELSGGQQQRVSIARALINGAEVILADEPTGALDSHSGQQVLELLQQLNRESGTTIILITHDANVAEHADRIIQMKDGQVLSDRANANHILPPHNTTSSRLSANENTDQPQRALPVFPCISLWSSFALALNALNANWFRTLLTLLGIIIGVAAVVTMMAIGEGGKQQVLQRIEAMGTNLLQVRPGGRNVRSSGNIATLSMADAQAIATIDGVAAVAPERDGRSTLRYASHDYNARIRGVTPVYFPIRNWQLSQGILFDDTDLQRFTSVIVVGATIAEQLFPDGENPIGAYVFINSSPYQIIGVLKAKGASASGRDMDDEAYMPISTAQLKFFGSEYLSNITLKIADTQQLDNTEAAVTQLLEDRHGRKDFIVRNTASLVEAVNETQDTLTALLGAVAAISLLVGGIGVMNIMLVNVSERRREIGLRIATGAKPQDILRQFNIEALLVCLLGGSIGVVLGLAISLLVQSFNIAVTFSLFPPLMAFGTSLIVGWVFGYAPAHKAASLNPIAALAQE